MDLSSVWKKDLTALKDFDMVQPAAKTSAVADALPHTHNDSGQIRALHLRADPDLVLHMLV